MYFLACLENLMWKSLNIYHLKVLKLESFYNIKTWWIFMTVKYYICIQQYPCKLLKQELVCWGICCLKKELLDKYFSKISTIVSVSQFLKLTELIFLTSNVAVAKTINNASCSTCAEAAVSSNYSLTACERSNLKIRFWSISYRWQSCN